MASLLKPDQVRRMLSGIKVSCADAHFQRRQGRNHLFRRAADDQVQAASPPVTQGHVPKNSTPAIHQCGLPMPAVAVANKPSAHTASSASDMRAATNPRGLPSSASTSNSQGQIIDKGEHEPFLLKSSAVHGLIMFLPPQTVRIRKTDSSTIGRCSQFLSSVTTTSKTLSGISGTAPVPSIWSYRPRLDALPSLGFEAASFATTTTPKKRVRKAKASQCLDRITP